MAMATMAAEKKYFRLKREMVLPSIGARFQVRMRLNRSVKKLTKSAKEHKKSVHG
jgi:hypothetical protein